MLVRQKVPWTRQPPAGAPLNLKPKAFLSGNRTGIQFWTKVGDPTPVATIGGRGFTFGTGNYFSYPSLLLSGSGAGGETEYNSVEHITFVVTSNASLDAIASIGTSATDGGPVHIIQNNAGSLRVFSSGSYYVLGTAVVGKLHTITITYSDVAPYPEKMYLDGVLVVTNNQYRNAVGGKTTYVGTGYPAQAANVQVLQYYFEQPGNWADKEIFSYAQNPWQVFAP